MSRVDSPGLQQATIISGNKKADNNNNNNNKQQQTTTNIYLYDVFWNGTNLDKKKKRMCHKVKKYLYYTQ